MEIQIIMQKYFFLEKLSLFYQLKIKQNPDQFQIYTFISKYPLPYRTWRSWYENENMCVNMYAHVHCK